MFESKEPTVISGVFPSSSNSPPLIPNKGLRNLILSQRFPTIPISAEQLQRRFSQLQSFPRSPPLGRPSKLVPLRDHRRRLSWRTFVTNRQAPYPQVNDVPHFRRW